MLYIDGRWQLPADGGTIDVVDPATEEIFAEISAGCEADISAAVAAAAQAFDSGWGRSPSPERAAFLRELANRIEADATELAVLETRDNGKPLAESKWDIADTIECFRLFADLGEGLDDQQNRVIDIPDGRFSTNVRREPVGVVGQIIPWNYPLLMAAWKVAPALAAGSTVVLKPSEFASLTALRLAGYADDIGLPRGVLNVVTGLGREAGKPLAEHPRVDKLAFTGSVPTGAAVMRAAAQDIKNVSLELGGKSAIIVFDDADLEAAVEWIMFGIFWNQGQVCSATSRLLVQRGIAERLLARLAEEAARIPIGPGLDPRSKLGPLISRQQHEKVGGFINRGRADGVVLATGGDRPSHLTAGFFWKPTIFVEPPVAHELWTEEIFGPVLTARRFTDESEAIDVANATRFGLAGAVMSANVERCERVARALRAGIIWINCSQPTFVQAPWGGVKQSGIGRELGVWGLDNYLETKQVTRYHSKQAWNWYLAHGLD